MARFATLPTVKGAKMYYNYSNPFQYDPFSEEQIRSSKRTFSRFHLALFIFTVVATAVAFLVEFSRILLWNDFYENSSELFKWSYEWAIGILPMYVVGLPILYLITKGMPKTKLKKSKLRFVEFLALFAISKALATVGSMIGSAFTGAFGAMRGEEVSNPTAELISESPIWFTIVIAVIIGPIVEEFIFRKIMIDKLAKFGTVPVIIVSGVSFGLFHGNFNQLFYATLLGMLLAYITFKTGNWLYSVLMHVTINFFSSVVVLPFIEIQNHLVGMDAAALEGGAPERAKLLLMSFAVEFYSIVEYALMLTGAILLVFAIKRKQYKLENNLIKLAVPREKAFSSIFANPGTIMYFSLSMLLLTASLLL